MRRNRRRTANHGHRIEVFERRPHIADHCYTERDSISGVMLHFCGPHILHNDDDAVWVYVNRYTEFRPYAKRVRDTTGGAVYSLPINLHTIAHFFDQTLAPAATQAFIEAKTDTTIDVPRASRSRPYFVGRNLYEAFSRPTR